MKKQHWLFVSLIPLAAILFACPEPPKPKDFSVSSSPALSTVALTKSSNITVNIERINGFADSVTVGLLTAPTGITSDPLSISSSSGVLVVKADATAALGEKTLTIEASSGNLKKTTTININVIQSEQPKVTVDTTLKPTVTTIPSLDGGAPRALASLSNGANSQSDFVLNEMLIETSDKPKLDALLLRWGGIILHETDFNTIGTIFKSGSDPAPHYYLVKINPAAADVSGLSKDLEKLSPLANGDFRVSSSETRKFLAAVASEAADQGMKVSANLIMSPASIATGLTTEAASAAAGYNPNAFTWDYMGSGAGFPMNTGVAQAWQRLQSAGRFANRVGILVADGGFSPSTAGLDLPPVQAFGATEQPNSIPCGGGACPWHGSDVLSSLAGIPDNGLGVAGPAGPIAALGFAQSPLINIRPGFDVGGVIRAIGSSLEYVAGLADALSRRPRILNFSGTFKVDGGWGFLVEPMNGMFNYFKNSLGILTFASAGNEGTRDVDEIKCFVDVFDCLGGTARGEADVFVPCEVASVICVGGLAENATTKDANSSFGSLQRFAGETTDNAASDDRSVDIYGPFSVWVGANPDNAAPRRVTGTSFSSPFVAGVAALIWAAEPSLTAAQVQTILLETAHQTNDLVGTRGGLRVNALGAVARVLGSIPNQTLTRFGFSGDASLNRNFQIDTNFTDPDGNCCTTTWNPAPVSVSGLVGGQRATFRFTTTGNQVITATTRDTTGNTVVSSITIGIINNPPIATMSLPTTTITVFRGQPVTFRGFATDQNEGVRPDPELLPCSNLRFRSSLSADSTFPRTPMGAPANCEISHTFNTNGSRTISLTATDSQGEPNFAPPGRTINVIDPPVNLPPNITLGTLPPTDYSTGYNWLSTIAITASATDPEGNTPIQYRWTATTLRPNSTVVYAGPTIIADWSSTSNLSWNPSGSNPTMFGDFATFGNACYDGQTVRLVLEARDSLNNTSSINVPNFTVFKCVLI
jgi:serine protease